MKLLKKAAIASVMLLASQAWGSSTSFTSVGQSATFNWNFTNVDGANLIADVTFKLKTIVDTDTWTFEVMAKNSSTGTAPATNSNRLVSFGIGVVNPDLLETSDNSGNWETKIDVNFPAFGKVDFCAYAGSQCSGGSNGGLLMGAEDTFEVTMNFKTAIGTDGVTFSSPYASKWQSVGSKGGSWELEGCLVGDTTGCKPRPPQEIPEPASLALVGLALLGLGAASRRRRA